MTYKRSTLFRVSVAVFLLAEAALFYLIHFEKAEPGFSLRYTSIIIAAAFSWLTLIIGLITAKGSKDDPVRLILSLRDGNLLRIAMLFTLAADYFLVVLTEINRMAGMLFFIGTQLCIFLHLFLRENSKRARRAHLILRLFLMAVLVLATFIVLGDGADALAIISVIYYANLLTSVIFAPRDKRGGKLLCLGLVLFALCDVNVGLAVLHDLYGGFAEGSFLYLLTHLDVDLAWVFYIPSQTIIPLTLLLKEKSADV